MEGELEGELEGKLEGELEGLIFDLLSSWLISEIISSFVGMIGDKCISVVLNGLGGLCIGLLWRHAFGPGRTVIVR